MHLTVINSATLQQNTIAKRTLVSDEAQRCRQAGVLQKSRHLIAPFGGVGLKVPTIPWEWG